MKNFLRALLLAIIPILRATARDIVVEAVDAALYPEKKDRRRNYRQSNFDKMAQRRPFIPSQRGDGFDSVITVAFHIAGPSRVLVEEWIQNRLPKPEERPTLGINLKSVHIFDEENEG